MTERARRIAVVGGGRMGRAVVSAVEAAGHQVAVVITGARGRSPAPFESAELDGAEVAIEFTAPDAAEGMATRLLDAGLPLVSGTTGWAEGVARVADRVRERGGALLHASNFSVGAHLLFRTARLLGGVLAGRPELDAMIRERHHRGKVDAPSGTALTLQAALREVDSGRDYPISSERLGHHPGLHSLAIDGQYEELTVTHAVRDRAVFASGAVLAAAWLVGRQGVYGFEQVLFGDER